MVSFQITVSETAPPPHHLRPTCEWPVEEAFCGFLHCCVVSHPLSGARDNKGFQNLWSVERADARALGMGVQWALCRLLVSTYHSAALPPETRGVVRLWWADSCLFKSSLGEERWFFCLKLNKNKGKGCDTRKSHAW